MKLVWFMEEKAYNNYVTNKPKEETNDYGEPEYCGCVRVGNLCFDILNWTTHLRFDLYVGGVDSGYGYSVEDDYKDYPYDYCDAAGVEYKEVDPNQ